MNRCTNNLTNRISNPLRTFSACSLSLATLGLSLAVLSPTGAQEISPKSPLGREATNMERMLLPPAVIPPLKAVTRPHGRRANAIPQNHSAA